MCDNILMLILYKEDFINENHEKNGAGTNNYTPSLLQPINRF